MKTLYRGNPMSETAQKLLPELLALPVGDRVLLTEALAHSVPEDEEDDSEFIAMLNRRWDDIVSGREKGIPGDEVMAEARKRFP